MTERIDHAGEARKLIEKVETALAPIRDRNDLNAALVTIMNQNFMRDIAAAQVKATLALVEQQRIANVIAIHQHEVKYDIGEWSRLYVAGTEGLKPEIAEALGLS